MALLLWFIWICIARTYDKDKYVPYLARFGTQPTEPHPQVGWYGGKDVRRLFLYTVGVCAKRCNRRCPFGIYINVCRDCPYIFPPLYTLQIICAHSHILWFFTFTRSGAYRPHLDFLFCPPALYHSMLYTSAIGLVSSSCSSFCSLRSISIVYAFLAPSSTSLSRLISSP